MGRTDEEIAEALQEKYRQEFLLRQQRRDTNSNGGRSNATTASGGSAARQLRASRASAPPEHEVKSSSRTTNTRQQVRSSSVVDEDTLLAQRLQQEFDVKSSDFMATGSSPPPPPYNSVNRNATTNNSPPRRQTSSASTDPFILDDDERIAQELQDEEVARRMSRISALQSSTAFPPSHQSSFMDERGSGSSDDMRIAQEMRDAEMAQRLSTYEQEALRRMQHEQQQRQIRPRRSILTRILPLVCCGVAISIPILFVLGVFDSDDASDFFGDLGDAWIDTDPWKGETAKPFNPGGGGSGGTNVAPNSNAYAWPNEGNGLRLDILNAMDDSWQSDLKVALDNWEAGSPVDPLSFAVERIPYEVSCVPVDGKLKICNGNYGATRWRGINEVVLNKRTNEIVNSIAKMNEYYLPSNGNKDQRLYTICHELGHGFGLPHWDEDFYNEDLGNCMDYTSRPGNNKHPDASNFIYLAGLYGNGTTASVSQNLVDDNGDDNEEDEDDDIGARNGGSGGGGNGSKQSKSDGNRRHRHRQLRTNVTKVENEKSDNDLYDDDVSIVNVHRHDNDGTISQLMVSNDRIQVHYRELDNDHVHVYQYLLS